MTTWTLRLDNLTPPAGLLPNNRLRRGGQYVGRGLARRYRADVATVARAARNRADLPAPLFPGPVRVRVTVAWERYLAVGPTRTRWQYRRWPDPDGLDAALKPLWDGLQDAGVLGDDRHLMREPVRQINDPNGYGYVEIVFSEER